MNKAINAIAEATRALLELLPDAEESRAREVWADAHALKKAVLEEIDLAVGTEGKVEEWLRNRPFGAQEIDLGDGRSVALTKSYRAWKLRQSSAETLDIVMQGLGGDFDEVAACLSSQPFKPAETAKRLALADATDEGEPPTKKQVDAIRNELFTREPVTKPTEKGPRPVRKATVMDKRYAS